MLSICIPIYNHYMDNLVGTLSQQASDLDEDVELLLIDDCSDNVFQKKNRELAKLKPVRYEELQTNIGRSKIRNLLSRKAKYPHLLFLDCDSEVPDSDYLKRYIHCIKDDAAEAIVYGGRSYLDAPKSNEYRLHWLFGSNREVKTAASRNKNPWQSFMSNNFLIHKKTLLSIPFNEQLSGYGHEDTLLGYELKKRGIPIRHIDNPLLHVGLETAEEFLAKTDEGLLNLLIINKILNHDPEFINTVRVLRLSHRMKRLKLLNTFAVVFSIAEKWIVRQLLGKSPKLMMLDFYKLGKICQYSIASEQVVHGT
jgi:glycosyltransferase involved in cell wall biosynthesis